MKKKNVDWRKRSLEEARKERNKVYQDKRWRTLRKERILKNPWCEDCLVQGKYTPALDVHHIKPWRRASTPEEKERLAFDPDNTVCLCRDCHVKRHLKMNEEIREKVEANYLKPIKSTFKRA